MRRILFATDFSKASTRAFETSLMLAKAHGTTLTILHVLVPFMPIMPEQYIGSQTWEQIDLQVRKRAKQELARLVGRARNAGLRTTGLLAEGEPARQIVRMARSRKAGLIVVGTHGRTGFSKLFLGSIASRVVATAQCPVVTVRGK
jgi:nucleotide-binding universal stress UspA family protein